jgi:hypothetical protein
LFIIATIVIAGCGPQFPQPDHEPRTAPVPLAQERAAAEEPAMPETADTSVHVDHAWVKDAASAAERARQRKSIEELRVKVVGGAGFVAAWESLGVDGASWHVAEGEVYDAAIIPASVRQLRPGEVSAVIPGDGGLHLFRMLD